MFVTQRAGKKSYYLVTDRSGEPIRDPILKYVGDSITVSGEVLELEDLKIFQIDVSSIQRRSLAQKE